MSTDFSVFLLVYLPNIACPLYLDLLTSRLPGARRFRSPTAPGMRFVKRGNVVTMNGLELTKNGEELEEGEMLSNIYSHILPPHNGEIFLPDDVKASEPHPWIWENRSRRSKCTIVY